jgi:hypothetical protein
MRGEIATVINDNVTADQCLQMGKCTASLIGMTGQIKIIGYF